MHEQILNQSAGSFTFFPAAPQPNLHPAKSEPFLAQVLQRGADMIYRVVDAEEAIDEEAFRSSLLGA